MPTRALLRTAAVRLRHARHGEGAAASRSLDTLREPIRDGVPIVGLEPSCMTVFRDELDESAPQRRGREAALRSRRFS